MCLAKCYHLEGVYYLDKLSRLEILHNLRILTNLGDLGSLVKPKNANLWPDLLGHQVIWDLKVLGAGKEEQVQLDPQDRQDIVTFAGCLDQGRVRSDYILHLNPFSIISK